MTAKVKICGITGAKDAKASIQAGADMLGFNFYPPSPRSIETSRAAAIIAELGDAAVHVGVFVNEDADTINRAIEITGINVVQLHGDEPAELIEQIQAPVIRAFRVGSKEDVQGVGGYGKAWALLVDSRTELYGGSGKVADWDLARGVKDFTRHLILAGGLGPDNVGEAIQKVGPWAVDAASGVEIEPGKKDHDLVKKFIEAVKNVS